jgi:tetratricopeptide (TPR) repeat protein
MSRLDTLKRSKFGLLFVFLLLLANCSWAASTLEGALADFQAGQYEQALESFRSLHNATPTNPDLTFYLARSLYRKLQLKEAESLLLDSLETHPGHVESHYLLGSVQLSRVSEVNIFRKAGLAKSAVEAWEEAVRLNPDHAEALYGVASFYFSAPGIAGGDTDKGEQNLAKLERLSPPWAALTRASNEERAEDYAAAEQLFETAIEGIPHRAFPSLMLANLYLKQGQYDAALDTLEQYQQREKTWNDPGKEQTALVAGKIYQGLDKPEAAIKSFELVKRGIANEAMKDQAEAALEKLYSR